MPGLRTRRSLPAVSMSCNLALSTQYLCTAVQNVCRRFVNYLFNISLTKRLNTESYKPELICVFLSPRLSVLTQSVSYCPYLNATRDYNGPWWSSRGGRTLSLPRATSADNCVPNSLTHDEELFLAVTQLRNSHFRTLCDCQYCLDRTPLYLTGRLLLVINFLGCMVSVRA
jgi:hypothetical protein